MNIQDLFEKAAVLDPKEVGYRIEHELRNIKFASGVRRFKDELEIRDKSIFDLFFGHKVYTKSLDEVAAALASIGLATSLDDGRNIAREIFKENQIIPYNISSTIRDHLVVTPVNNLDGKLAYQMRISSFDPGDW